MRFVRFGEGGGNLSRLIGSGVFHNVRLMWTSDDHYDHLSDEEFATVLPYVTPVVHVREMFINAGTYTTELHLRNGVVRLAHKGLMVGDTLRGIAILDARDHATEEGEPGAEANTTV